MEVGGACDGEVTEAFDVEVGGACDVEVNGAFDVEVTAAFDVEVDRACGGLLLSYLVIHISFLATPCYNSNEGT